MDPITARTLRKDLSIIASLILLGLVALSALTGLAMDEAPEVIPVDDVHALTGFAMAAVAGFHALLNLRSMHKYSVRRLRGLAGHRPEGRSDNAQDRWRGGHDEMPRVP